MGQTKTQRKIRLRKPTSYKVSDLARPLAGVVVLTKKDVQQALLKAGMEVQEVADCETNALSGHFDSLRLGQISLAQGGDQELFKVCDRLTVALDKALEVITEHDQSPDEAYSGHYGGAFRQLPERIADWLNPEALRYDEILKNSALKLSDAELRRYEEDPSPLVRASAYNLLWFRGVVWRCRNILDKHVVRFGKNVPLRNVLVANLLVYWLWKCEQRGHSPQKNGKFNRAAAAVFIRAITRRFSRKASALWRDGAWDAADYLRELKALRSPDITELKTVISDLLRQRGRSEKMLKMLRQKADALYGVG